jgi:rhomboid-related protein 1/2/3
LIRERPNQCQDIPEGFCRTIGNYDADDNGQLDFEEFFKMCKEHHWLVRDWGVKYCAFLIAPRAPVPSKVPMRATMARSTTAYTAAYDTTDYSLFNLLNLKTFLHNNFIIADDVVESYGKQIKFCPPPITMVIFSIVEVCFFIADVVHFK